MVYTTSKNSLNVYKNKENRCKVECKVGLHFFTLLTRKHMKTEELIIKVKKTHQDAVIPTYAKPRDAGMDLTAVTKERDSYGNWSYGTGLAFEIPEGYVGLIYPRSSNSRKQLILSNSVGVIDSGYRGEVSLKFAEYNSDSKKRASEFSYAIGDRIGQLIIMPYPKVSFQEVGELSETERGEGGYGSTGR